MISRRKLLAGLAVVAAIIPFRSALSSIVKPEKKNIRLEKWQCVNENCEPYIYDPSVGDINVIDPNNPIPPGVAFEGLPDGWICPVCADPKRFFVPAGEWVEVEIS